MTAEEFQAVRSFISNGSDFIRNKEDLRRELVKIGQSVVVLDQNAVTNWINKADIRKNESVMKEVQKLSECRVLLDSSVVAQWMRTQLRVKATSVKVVMNMDRERGKMFSAYIPLARIDDPPQLLARPRAVNNTPMFPVNLKRQVVSVRVKSPEEANRRRFRINRQLNVNKEPVRQQVVKCGIISRMNRISGDRPYACTRCSKTFKHVQSRNFHFRDKHLHMVRYRCNLCPKQFLSLGNYRVHMRRHRGVKSFKCTRCAFASFSQGRVNQHRKLCGKRQARKCPMCDRVLKTPYGLREHMIVELSKRKYRCHRCGMQTKYFGSIYKHVAKCILDV